VKQLIINADDFGWDVDTVDATIALFEEGKLTSATIMTGREGTKRAVEFARTAPKSYSFGLHFNIVDGHPPCAERPNSLCGSEGNFRSSNQQRLAALFGRLKASDIAAELRAQLSIMREMGVEISHIDSHGHLHKFPAIAHAIAPVLEEFCICKVRRPQNLYDSFAFSNVIDIYCDKRFPRFKITEYFFMTDNQDGKWFADLVPRLKNGVTEVGVHPGRAETWRCIQTESLKKYNIDDLAHEDIQLISYHDLTSA